MNMILWVILLFLGIIAAVLIRRRYFSSISDIPGPFLASCTSIWQIWKVIDGHTEAISVMLHEKHGHFVRLAPREVSVSHPDAIKAILLAPIRKAPYYEIFSLPDKRYINQMSETDPKRHVHKERNVAAGYSLSNISKSESFIDDAIILFEKRLDELAAEGKPMEPDFWFNAFAMDVAGEVTFSQSFGFLESGKDLGDAIANTHALGLFISVLGYLPFTHDWFLALNPVMERFNINPAVHVFDTTLAAVEARSRNPDVRKDMMQEWLDTRRKFPERMDEKEILASAVANVGAAGDTTSAALQSFFYHLLRNEKALFQLRSEIDAAQGDGRLSRVISNKEAQQLPYLQACFKEAMRIHSPVNFGLPRIVPEDGLTIAGRYFEPGITVSVNPWVIHHQTNLFGADAGEFNPERWLESPERTREMDKYFIPFGAGYNSCPGKHLARMEITKLASTLIRDFDFEQVNPGQEWAFKSHFSSPQYGWPCYFKRRNT